MKYLIALLLAGCSTVVYNPRTGKPAMRTYADARNISYNADGSFHADSLNHSGPTRAAGSVIGTTGTAATGILTTLLIK